MGYIHSIQTFGTVDGPGVRFVVFFQGCPMRCQYCHNPDTWDIADGKEKSADEILEMFERNRAFYRTGGITATGGEPMMQMDFLIELFTKAKEKEIHTCLDTSGIFFREEWLQVKQEGANPTDDLSGIEQDEAFVKFEKLMTVTDLVMLDIKHIETESHKTLTGHGNEKVLAFAKYLDEMKKPVWIRHVVVPGITYREEQLTQLGEFLKTLSNVEKLEVLPYHTLGENKYEKLGLDYPLKGVQQLSKDEAVKAENIILAAWGKDVKPINTTEEDIKSGGTICKSC